MTCFWKDIVDAHQQCDTYSNSINWTTDYVNNVQNYGSYDVASYFASSGAKISIIANYNAYDTSGGGPTAIPQDGYYLANYIAYGGGVWVGAGNGSGSRKTIHGTNGLTYVQGNDLPVGNTYWYNVKYGGGKFVAIGNLGSSVSTDGINWGSFNAWPSSFNGDMYHLAYNGSTWCAIDYSSYNAFTSTNGTSWTQRTVQSTDWNSFICWTGQVFVIAGGEGAIQTSPDGITWTLQTGISATGLYPYGLASNSNGVIVVTYHNGSTYSSFDHGVTFTAETDIPSAHSTRWDCTHVVNDEFIVFRQSNPSYPGGGIAAKYVYAVGAVA